ncbi:hypothetical protein DFH06DRAFT_1131016 [Mycena polygramma]|nr:hypothetical protein DFH06DRAFT_1131016 [Mycena polygramma]
MESVQLRKLQADGCRQQKLHAFIDFAQNCRENHRFRLKLYGNTFYPVFVPYTPYNALEVLERIRHKREKVRRKQPGNRRTVQVRQEKAWMERWQCSPTRPAAVAGGLQAGTLPAVTTIRSLVYLQLNPPLRQGFHPSVAPILAIQPRLFLLFLSTPWTYQHPFLVATVLRMVPVRKPDVDIDYPEALCPLTNRYELETKQMLAEALRTGVSDDLRNGTRAGMVCKDTQLVWSRRTGAPNRSRTENPL